MCPKKGDHFYSLPYRAMMKIFNENNLQSKGKEGPCRSQSNNVVTSSLRRELLFLVQLLHYFWC